MADEPAGDQLADLDQAFGHRFARRSLVTEALTHRSATPRDGASSGRAMSYERLEFLGDRVLGLVVADMLINRFPREPEGALARRLTGLVRREALARVAESVGIAPHIALSKGEEDAGGRRNPAILADCCEAIIGALFVDGGFEVARTFVRRYWTPLMEEAVAPPMDAKTALQEWAQARGRPLPKYAVVSTSGPAHGPRFEVEVTVDGGGTSSATGTSKRFAEQAAAQRLLDQLGGTP